MVASGSWQPGKIRGNECDTRCSSSRTENGKSAFPPLSSQRFDPLEKLSRKILRGSNRHLSRLVEINHVADIRYAGRKVQRIVVPIIRSRSRACICDPVEQKRESVYALDGSVVEPMHSVPSTNVAIARIRAPYRSESLSLSVRTCRRICIRQIG